ncbi:hypothetical protein ATANTOWER_009850 [Ataeniobius toweri]|uniref:Uncharacterized protein n=1 Tax=Ataeniobius toweri TaxID=208326 RepID=A0ABU7A924_9TELE|nr:hypothetical protein [Ataeniobius toweri]
MGRDFMRLYSQQRKSLNQKTNKAHSPKCQTTTSSQFDSENKNQFTKFKSLSKNLSIQNLYCKQKLLFKLVKRSANKSQDCCEIQWQSFSGSRHYSANMCAVLEYKHSYAGVKKAI